MVGLTVTAPRLTFECFISILIILIIIFVVLQIIFQVLILFLKIIFIVMIDLTVNIFYLLQQYQKLKQWNQLSATATMCCFYLSCKDHFFSNWVRMFKLSK